MRNMILINLLIQCINLYRVKNKPITLIYYTYSIVELFIIFHIAKFSIKLCKYQNINTPILLLLYIKHLSLLTATEQLFARRNRESPSEKCSVAGEGCFDARSFPKSLDARVKKKKPSVARPYLDRRTPSITCLL